MNERILVIKLGAFGDLIQALGPMAAIRRHHPQAHITLLTTKPFVALAQASGYADDIWTDKRPAWLAFGDIATLSRKLRQGRFTRVYDLQNNDRTALYLWLTGLTKKSRPEWVGAAFGASYRNASPERIAGHAFDGHVQTLSLAGIHDVAVDTLDWIKGQSFDLPHPYILLVPGSAPNRPEKRWPAVAYGRLAGMLQRRGLTPVIIGTAQESETTDIIARACPGAINLCGKTAMTDLAGLARGAAAAIGNDTGPMHMIAPTGCPVLVLFSQHSDPVRHAPKGAGVKTLQRANLAELQPETVMEEMMQSSHIRYMESTALGRSDRA